MNNNNDSFLVELKVCSSFVSQKLKILLYRSLFKTAVSVLFETPSSNAKAIYQPNTLHNINRKCFYPPNTFYHLWQSFIYSDRKVQGMISSYRNIHNDNTTQPQHCSWVGHEIDCANHLTTLPPPPPQKIRFIFIVLN